MASLGLVVAEFYHDLAEEMEAYAHEAADERDADVVKTHRVPGAYDAPLAADRLARREDVDAVAVVGAIVSGDTDHDQVIGRATAEKLADVSLDRDTPVAFGVTGPGMSEAEAYARSDYGARAVNSALDVHEELDT